MQVRPSTLLFQALLGGAFLAIAAGVHAAAQRSAYAQAVSSQVALVARLDLTDLCLFTDAQYARHPSQTDRFAPFQDHPRAIEHFPSGSLASRPW